jgi:hypothetical protein
LSRVSDAAECREVGTRKWTILESLLAEEGISSEAEREVALMDAAAQSIEVCCHRMAKHADPCATPL